MLTSRKSKEVAVGVTRGDARALALAIAPLHFIPIPK